MLRDQMIDRGLASAEQIDRHLAALRAGELDLCTATLISAWGRRA
jgi:hypothetical protein